jgi:hypothetical protein
MLLPLQESEARAHPRIWLFAIGAAWVGLFGLWEGRLGARGGHPLLDLKPLTIRSYSVGATIVAAFYAGFAGVFLVMTMFLQQGLNYSPLSDSVFDAIKTTQA